MSGARALFRAGFVARRSSDIRKLRHQMIDDIVEFLHKWIPRYQESQRSYLTVAIGCTGGMHRSVYVAEAIASRLGSASHAIRTHHNELR